MAEAPPLRHPRLPGQRIGSPKPPWHIGIAEPAPQDCRVGQLRLAMRGRLHYYSLVGRNTADWRPKPLPMGRVRIISHPPHRLHALLPQQPKAVFGVGEKRRRRRPGGGPPARQPARQPAPRAGRRWRVCAGAGAGRAAPQERGPLGVVAQRPVCGREVTSTRVHVQPYQDPGASFAAPRLNPASNIAPTSTHSEVTQCHVRRPSPPPPSPPAAVPTTAAPAAAAAAGFSRSLRYAVMKLTASALNTSCSATTTAQPPPSAAHSCRNVAHTLATWGTGTGPQTQGGLGRNLLWRHGR